MHAHLNFFLHLSPAIRNLGCAAIAIGLIGLSIVVWGMKSALREDRELRQGATDGQ